jgi:glycerol kinase
MAATRSARHQLEHEQILPRAGWVEHNPVEIWERSTSVIRTAMNAQGLEATDLAALGVTNQRETTVVWNRRTGRPYYNAIVGQDIPHRPDRVRTGPRWAARSWACRGTTPTPTSLARHWNQSATRPAT